MNSVRGGGGKYDRRWGETGESREKIGETQKRAKTAEEENLHSSGDCSYTGYDSSFILLKSEKEKAK